MKDLLIILLFFIGFILGGCVVTNAPTATVPETTVVETSAPETTEPTVDMSTADALLEDIVQHYLADDTFIDVVKANIPDIHTLKEFHAACWTYFFIMEDGTEYIITTDYDGKIMHIDLWLDGYHGDNIYELDENDKPFEI